MSYKLDVDVSESKTDLIKIKGLLLQIKGLKNQIFGEDQHLPSYCMACGEYIGTYILQHQTMAPIDTMPVCRKCFGEKIGKIVNPKDKIPHVD